MPEIYTLRVKRGVVGNAFPFDRIYLVRHGEHDCLRQLFRYALVLPVTETLEEMLRVPARPESITDRPLLRNDEGVSRKISYEDWSKILDNGPWVMGVPILTRYIKAAIPRYITAAEWYRTPRYRRVGRRGSEVMPDKPSPFPTMTYLQTPEKDIRPICVMCPRFILHQNDECRPGQPVCFEEGNLTLGLQNYFKEGLEAPKPAPNIHEPEVEEMIANGDVQDE